MKKLVGLMMVVFMMVLCGTALGDYWDEVEMQNLFNEEIEWCKNHGCQKYVDDVIDENKMLLCCGMVTKDDAVFYDATPDTVTDPLYGQRIEEFFNTEMHSMEIIHVDTVSGYGLYRIIMKWNTPVQLREEMESVYGMDCFVRFYN